MRPDSQDLNLALDFVSTEPRFYQELNRRDNDRRLRLIQTSITFRGINQNNNHLMFDVTFNYSFQVQHPDVSEDLIARVEIDEQRNRFFIGWRRMHF